MNLQKRRKCPGMGLGTSIAQAHRRQFSHQVLLKQYQRKWKTEDIMLCTERRKRILRTRQEQLMEKEKAHEEQIKQGRLRDKLGQQKMFSQTIQELAERDKLMDTLTKVLASNEDLDTRNQILEEEGWDLKINTVDKTKEKQK